MSFFTAISYLPCSTRWQGDSTFVHCRPPLLLCPALQHTDMAQSRSAASTGQARPCPHPCAAAEFALPSHPFCPAGHRHDRAVPAISAGHDVLHLVNTASSWQLLPPALQHIDTAEQYGNEDRIGAALSTMMGAGRVKREELWVTTKLWSNNHAAANVKKAAKASLAKLQLDHLDLYLIHW